MQHFRASHKWYPYQWLITLRSFRRDPFLQVVVGIVTDARYLDKVPSGRRDHLRRIFRGRPPEGPVSSAVLASLH